MNSIWGSDWFYWGIAVAIGLPVLLIALTEWQRSLRRRQSPLVRPVALLRNFLLPLGALLLLLVRVTQMPSGATLVRTLSSVAAFGVLLLLLSALKAALFQSAPDGTWRKRLPSIFVDLVRFLLIAIGLAIIASQFWGANVKGLFTALGVTSVIVGLTLQNSVGQIISGLLMLFEQPFRLGDWLNTPTAVGRVVEVNWRAVHLETETGLQITPNSVLAAASFTNLSLQPGGHTLRVTSVFSHDDPPDVVCEMLERTASDLPQRNVDMKPIAVPLGDMTYRTDIPITSWIDDPWAKALFLRWVWYASRRAGLHLNEADDTFSTPERLASSIQAVVTPVLKLSPDAEAALAPDATITRYGSGEIISRSGEVPDHLTFIVSGEVRLTAFNSDGAEVAVGTLAEGDFVGQTVLTRQPVIGSAYAVGEITVVQVRREQIETMVRSDPSLVEEFGRAIEDRRDHVLRAIKAGSE